MPHMVSSEGEGRADVWSAEVSLSWEEEDVVADAELFVESMDAVAIDNRERTRSKGIGRTDRSDARKCTTGQSGWGIQLFLPMRCEPLFELFVCRELNSAVGNNSNAVDPISSHKSLETFLPPHSNETLPHSRVLLSGISRLDLSVTAAVRLENRDHRRLLLNDFQAL